jgi:hypothetical protein
VKSEKKNTKEKSVKEDKNGTNDVCSVIQCRNPVVTDGYCDAHLERLELIRESHEQVKQMQLRAREDEKEVSLERDQESAPTFGQTEEYIE